MQKNIFQFSSNLLCSLQKSLVTCLILCHQEIEKVGSKLVKRQQKCSATATTERSSFDHLKTLAASGIQASGRYKNRARSKETIATNKLFALWPLVFVAKKSASLEHVGIWFPPQLSVKGGVHTSRARLIRIIRASLFCGRPAITKKPRRTEFVNPSSDWSFMWRLLARGPDMRRPQKQ